MESLVYTRGYAKTLSEYIEQTFWLEIEKYPQITKHYKQMIDVRFLNDIDVLWEMRFERHKGHFTRKYVQESFSPSTQYLVQHSFEAVVFYKEDRENGIYHIDRMYLYANMPHILINMFSRISTLDTKTEDHIKHIIKINLRHEVGHILDYINEVDNKHVDHVNNLTKIDMESRNELYPIMDDLSDEEFFNRYYSQIPGERRANELVGLTPQDMIDSWKNEKGVVFK